MNEDDFLRSVQRQRRGLHLVMLCAALALVGLAAIVVARPGPVDGPPAAAAPTPAEVDRVASPPPPTHATDGFSGPAQRRRAEVFARIAPDPAFPRLPSPGPGDWLEHTLEPGQTDLEYAREDHNRKTASRHTLHIQPFDDLDETQRALLPELQRFIRAFFGVQVVVLPGRALPRHAWSAAREQWHAEKVVRDLRPDVPDDSLGVLGLMRGDLYAFDLSFVFGIGLFSDRVGAHSLHRYGTDSAALRSLAFHVAAHELGHMFGIEHCVFHRCVMNGINSLYELERSSPHLCPVCRAKLQNALGFDDATRYGQLAAVYAEHGMDDEAAFCRARAGATPTPDPPADAR